MGADLQRDTNEIWVVHVSESLPKEEIDVVQEAPIVSMGAALLVAPRTGATRLNPTIGLGWEL